MEPGYSRYGTTVVLERGARFEMGPGASVLCQGALRVRGTSLNPVFIRAAQDSAFGTFAVVGDGTTACDVRGLRISGGSTSIVNGTSHSAMLSFHQVDLHLENCVIGGSRGEDAVNVKNSKVSIMGCVFENGHADLVDLDVVTGTIDRCVFRSSSPDRNGDGVDLSGSQVTLLHSEFRGLPDKGLSVGEGSQAFVQACTS